MIPKCSGRVSEEMTFKHIHGELTRQRGEKAVAKVGVSWVNVSWAWAAEGRREHLGG